MAVREECRCPVIPYCMVMKGEIRREKGVLRMPKGMVMMAVMVIEEGEESGGKELVVMVWW